MENLQIRKLSKIQTSSQDDLQFVNEIQKKTRTTTYKQEYLGV